MIGCKGLKFNTKVKNRRSGFAFLCGKMNIRWMHAWRIGVFSLL